MCSCLGRPREHLNRSIVGSGFTQFHNRFASKMAPSSPPNASCGPDIARPVLVAHLSSHKAATVAKLLRWIWLFRQIHPFAVARPSAAAHQAHGTCRSVSRAPDTPDGLRMASISTRSRAEPRALSSLATGVETRWVPAAGEPRKACQAGAHCLQAWGPDLACPVGGIGRHTWFRSKRESMGVRVPHRAPFPLKMWGNRRADQSCERGRPADQAAPQSVDRHHRRHARAGRHVRQQAHKRCSDRLALSPERRLIAFPRSRSGTPFWSLPTSSGS